MVMVRVRVRVGKILIANMVRVLEDIKKRVREDFESEYGFPYVKKLNTGTGRH